MNFIDCIKNNDAANATSLIEAVLKQKTIAQINGQRSVVAEITYSEKENPQDELMGEE